MVDLNFLNIVRAAIATKQIPKKTLARRCGVSKPRFSEILHGDREMPPEVKERLISELEIDKTRKKMAVLLSGGVE